MKIARAVVVLSLLAGCTAQPAEDVLPETNAAAQKRLEKDAKSIDEAADQAAKLIEEDARMETPTQ